MNEKLVIIDSNAVIHRAYHALPKSMSNRGVLTNAVYGYMTTLIKVLEDLEPKYVIASFDLAGPTFRHQTFKEYKGTRVKADQELYDQIPIVREMLEKLDIKIFEKEGYEADDIIGTVVEIIKERNQSSETPCDVYIVSGDKDVFQLINSGVFVYNLKKGLSQTEIVDQKVIKRDWNLDPEDFIDLKALAGDPSDNIPGVPGVGPKTAVDLLQKFDSLENLYKTIRAELPEELSNECKVANPETEYDKLEMKEIVSRCDCKINRYESEIETIAKSLEIKPRILRLLITYNQQAFMSQHLARIDRNVPMEFDLQKVVWGNYDKEELAKFFRQFGFMSLLKRFGVEEKETPKTKKAQEQQEKDKQLKLL